MMTRRFTAILLALAASGLALADTITMKDGTKYEGEVLSEEGDSYLISVQVTPSIKEERRFPKEDVASIERSSADDLAFEKIKDLVPTADRLTAKDYDAMINEQVKAFITAFPATSHKKQVRTILETLEAERDLAASGALKLNGSWIKAADREANAFEIDASIVLAEMKAAASNGSYQVAMRKFEELDKDFVASDSYGAGVELAISVLDAYRPEIAGGIRRVDLLIPKRKTELELLTEIQRKNAYGEIARLDQLYEARIQEEKKMPTKWLTIEQYHKGPMEEVLRNIDSEKKRLTGLNLDEIKKAGATYREAYAAAAAGEKEEAATLISTLKSMRIPERYIEALESKLAATLAESEPAEPSPGTPDTPAPAPDKETMPDKTDPADNTGTEPSTANNEPEDDKTAATSDEPPAAPRDPVDTETGSSPLKIILFVVMAVVIVIALIAMFAGGKKK